MAKLRSVSTAFWSDPFIEDLTPNEKLLFLYLVTNEKTNMLGIYESSIKKIAFETGLKKEEVNKALKGFERVNKVKYINNFVILINFMKHQNFNVNMKKSAIDVYNNLPKELKNNNLDISKTNPLKGFESLLNHFGMVRKVEVEEEIEDEEEEEVKEPSFEERTQKFLDWFNQMLKIHNGKQGAFKILSKTSQNNYKQLLKAKVPTEDFESVFKEMIKNDWVVKNKSANPSHFLAIDNFNRYLQKSNSNNSKPNMI